MDNRLKTFKPLFFLLLLSIMIPVTNAQTLSPFAGFWKAMLPISKYDSLTVSLVFEYKDGKLCGEMDSPDQYSFGIPIQEIKVNDDTLFFKSTGIGVLFKGFYDPAADCIKGVFKQGGLKKYLSFSRIEKRFFINRPQEPKPPYPYEVKDIEWASHSGTKGYISGTLTMPSQQTPKSLLIMISGSGWQNRDEAIFSHKPFLVIADYFTRAGYAVFRYDDIPKPLFAKATTLDFAADVSLIIDSLKEMSALSNCKVTLVGHSEGGLVAFISAAQDKRVDYIISMAGVAEPISHTLLYQLDALLRADKSFSEQEIKQSNTISSKLYSVVEKNNDKTRALKKAEKFLNDYSKNMSPETKEKLGMTEAVRFAKLQQLTSPWMFTLFHLSPTDYMRKVKCPVLALNGTLDLQVNANANFDIMKRYLSCVSCVPIEGCNHLFQKCTSGLSSEYGIIEETISPTVLALMKEWMESQNEIK